VGQRGARHALAEAVPLAGRAGELERGVHRVRLPARALGHALREEGVPAREQRHRQDAHA